MRVSEFNHSNNFALFCKSYRNDVLRAKRLLESIKLFNHDKIPFYLSSPLSDKQLFIETLGSDGYTWIADEEIAAANTRQGASWLENTHGGIAQEVIKSEFWRLNLCQSYLCLDSDAQFLRPFRVVDFVHPTGVPYSLMHDAIDYLSAVDAQGFPELRQHYLRESQSLKAEFSRENGPDYDFGPPPMIWSAKVWEWLDKQYLAPKGLTLLDAINAKPVEIRWYGEALLASQVIPIYPVKPLFKFYYYFWQYQNDQKLGITKEQLAKDYLGAVYQSTWESELDPAFARRNFLSRAWRKFKQRKLGKT